MSVRGTLTRALSHSRHLSVARKYTSISRHAKIADGRSSLDTFSRIDKFFLSWKGRSGLLWNHATRKSKGDASKNVVSRRRLSVTDVKRLRQKSPNTCDWLMWTKARGCVRDRVLLAGPLRLRYYEKERRDGGNQRPCRTSSHRGSVRGRGATRRTVSEHGKYRAINSDREKTDERVTRKIANCEYL